MRLSLICACAGLAFSAAGGFAPAAAGTLQVNPVLIEIGDRQRSGSVTITNIETVPVVIRAYALGWSQDSGEDRYEESGAMIVSPPVFTIPAGGTQIVRVGPRAAVREPRAFRLMIEEVPEASQGAGIRVALRLNLPLYTQMAAGAATDLTWTALRGPDGQWTLEARNGGGGWVRVDTRAAEAATGVRFGAGFVFGTVLPRGSRRWTIGANPMIADGQRFQRLGAANDGTSLAQQRAR